MRYITAGEAAKKWGVSGRSVNYHLIAGRIPGAFKKGKLWLLPADAKRPEDKRRTTREQPDPDSGLVTELLSVFKAASYSMPIHDPDAIIKDFANDRIGLIYEAELSYLRGDFKRVITCCDKVAGDDALKLRICPISLAAAISLGDYHAYTDLEGYLRRFQAPSTDRKIRAIADFSVATVAVSLLAPSMVPDFVKRGDFSLLPPETRPNALYLKAKHEYSMARFDTSLAIAQTALTLSAIENTMSLTDLYLCLMCAASSYGLGERDETERWLLIAMKKALPCGFISPFVEHISLLGGLTEQCLMREFPDDSRLVMEAWERTSKNWGLFHNQFARDNITLILTLREYHIAVLAARGVPYTKIAEQYGISIGRLKNIMLEIREKLCISNRDELKKFIL